MAVTFNELTERRRELAADAATYPVATALRSAALPGPCAETLNALRNHGKVVNPTAKANLFLVLVRIASSVIRNDGLKQGNVFDPQRRQGLRSVSNDAQPPIR